MENEHWQISKKGNKWRKAGRLTATVFRTRAGYTWCLADADGPSYADTAWDTEREAIAESLAEDGRLELRGFGVFTAKRRQERNARNPKTGEPVQVPSKVTVAFRPSRQWCEAIIDDLAMEERRQRMRQRRQAEQKERTIKMMGW